MHIAPFITLAIAACALFVFTFLVGFGSAAQFALYGVVITVLFGLTVIGIKE